MFEADEGFQHLDEAVQHLLQRLGIGQGGYPAQQGLRLLPVFGLALPTAHQLHQGGLQLVAKGFQFRITNHLVSSAVSAVEKDHARYHQVAVCQLTVWQTSLLTEGERGDEGDVPQPGMKLIDKLA